MPGRKRIAILQSAYIPWKGYFDLIGAVDEFVIYDDMQYTHHDWRNRNQIKTPQGVQWISIPVASRGRFGQTIWDTQVKDVRWSTKHWTSLQLNYGRSNCFSVYKDHIGPIYLELQQEKYLSKINRRWITAICNILGITTHITCSQDYQLIGDRNQRLVEICRQAGATEYVSGPAARSYIDQTLFAAADIKLTWFDYAGYPEYPQLWGEFQHGVTILDLLFNCGADATRYMKFRKT